MNARENLLRAYTFRGPERIPMFFKISGAAWRYYGFEPLRELIESHPLLFPDTKDLLETGRALDFPPWQRAQTEHRDSWGCIWRTTEDGITGAVVHHPLNDWGALEAWTPPDPAEHDGWGAVQWGEVAMRIEQSRRSGNAAWAELRHGFFFLTLTYLRGYVNLIYDMCDEEPRLNDLMETVRRFNHGVLDRLLSFAPDIVGFPEDLGMQHGPMISPDLFRRYLKPVYRALMQRAKQRGALIHMHSDGDIMALAEDLLECGVEVLNLQDLVNGVDEIRRRLKGRVAIDLDVDRQSVTVNGSPGDVRDLIHEAVDRLSSPAGGLSLCYGLYPPTPLANVRALMDAMEASATSRPSRRANTA